jgi:hypothetical protein
MTSGTLCPDGDRLPAGPTDAIGSAFAAESRTIVRVDVG